MSADPIIAVFLGGTSSEREVSLGSGAACAQALAKNFRVETFDVTQDAIPTGISRERHVVFSTLHGGFGENGGMQQLLENAGIQYAGCGPESCALTIDKTKTKQAVSRKGIQVARGITFSSSHKPDVDLVVSELGEAVVVKPNDQGSSVGLTLVEKRSQLEGALGQITQGNWLIEERIVGREVSIGILNRRAMGVVEIRPKSGIYDYSSKYTKGLTEYLAPAPFEPAITTLLQNAAEAAFAACDGRDYGRVDFIFSAERGLFLLEINPLPGMKETSLLPMSARCVGLDFPALLKEMVLPAMRRFQTDQALLKT